MFGLFCVTKAPAYVLWLLITINVVSLFCVMHLGRGIRSPTLVNGEYFYYLPIVAIKCEHICSHINFTYLDKGKLG